MKLAGIAPAGIVNAILDHGGPIVTQSPDSVFQFRSFDEHKNAVMGLLNDLLCILVRQTPQEHVFGYLPFRSSHLVVSRIG